MKRAILILAAVLLLPQIAPAAAQNLACLLAAVKAAAPSVTDISVGTWGNPATVTVTPANQQAAAQAAINSFDYSQANLDSCDNTSARTAADNFLDTDKSQMGKLLRAVAAVLVDELNILRGTVIGTGTVVWDAASMTNATGLTSPNITVTGARFGDFVDVAAPFSMAGLTATGFVSANDTVVIRLHNGTGAAVNPASGTYNVTVRRETALAPRTLQQAINAIKSKIDAGTVD